eukprot:TRINITY_DN2438_c0_g1_i3.p1 TRINITY_DN2438_c0_g1~~TRINITY_DN2438_c0_g1_i3.p1  ORF type:complete len:167 (+),score=38.05 TRINITY_DN2438_c0_g1_i3:102-602(+)
MGIDRLGTSLKDCMSRTDNIPSAIDPALEEDVTCCFLTLNYKTATTFIVLLDVASVFLVHAFAIITLVAAAVAFYSILQDKFEWARRFYLYVKIIGAIVMLIAGAVFLVFCLQATEERRAVLLLNATTMISLGCFQLYLSVVFKHIIYLIEGDPEPSESEKAKITE